MAYKGSIDLISGIRQKNGGSFPLVDASAVQVGEDADHRLTDELESINGSVSQLNAEVIDLRALLLRIKELIEGGHVDEFTCAEIDQLITAYIEQLTVSEVER